MPISITCDCVNFRDGNNRIVEIYKFNTYQSLDELDEMVRFQVCYLDWFLGFGKTENDKYSHLKQSPDPKLFEKESNLYYEDDYEEWLVWELLPDVANADCYDTSSLDISIELLPEDIEWFEANYRWNKVLLESEGYYWGYSGDGDAAIEASYYFMELVYDIEILSNGNKGNAFGNLNDKQYLEIAEEWLKDFQKYCPEHLDEFNELTKDEQQTLMLWKLRSYIHKKDNVSQ